MPPPLFAVEPKSSTGPKANVNLLPCRIHHDGDVNPSTMFWNPAKTSGERDPFHKSARRGTQTKLTRMYTR